MFPIKSKKKFLSLLSVLFCVFSFTMCSENVEIDMNDNASIRSFYENYIYGKWQSGEEVSYSITDVAAGTAISGSVFPPPAAYTKLPRKNLEVNVKANGKETSFSVAVYLPQTEAADGFSYIVSFHPIDPIELALEKGFGLIVFTDYCSAVAQDNNQRKGAFYDLYPYKKGSQTGVLMAWSWGASKVLDALYSGAAEELGINKEASVITGVSRWGKAAAVCGAFETRFKMTAPACSGAGGLALFGYKSEGRTYDFSAKGGSSSYTYNQNEPLGSLQSSAEQGWFNNRFLQYSSETQIPINQENLINLCADENRYYFMIASCINEDWVNGPAMWACAKKSAAYYKEMGLENHLAANIHLQGHAVIAEDMKKMTEYFLCMTKNQELPSEIKKLTDFAREEFIEKK